MDPTYVTGTTYTESYTVPVAATYPLKELRRAQEDFMSKGFVGKLVVIP